MPDSSASRDAETPRARRSRPGHLGPVFERIARDQERARRSQRLDTLARRWEEIAGEDVARSTSVVNSAGGVVTIEVDSSALKAELEGFERDRLLAQMKSRVRFTRVIDIRFVLAHTRKGP